MAEQATNVRNLPVGIRFEDWHRHSVRRSTLPRIWSGSKGCYPCAQVLYRFSTYKLSHQVWYL
eukprot:scaffold473_cov156-Amphora_coffeaeformis.AAC.3